MAFATIDVTKGITGVTPVANGGTALSSGFVNGGGVTEADQWRVTSNFTGDANPVASNWERNDFNFDKIGTGMTESSGIFTFPSTGIWEIKYEGVSQIGGNAQNRWNDWKIEATTNSQYSSAQSSVIFDVTNVSTHKVRFSIDVNDGSTSQMGASGYQYHGATFIRLGDT